MTSILLVADVHANLAAFQAVLEDAARGGAVNEIWCLGDLVGLVSLVSLVQPNKRDKPNKPERPEPVRKGIVIV